MHCTSASRFHSRSFGLRWPALLPVIALGACVAYREAPLTLESAAARVDARTGGTLDYAAALELALQRHHDLHRLAAESRAAALDVPAASVELAAFGITADGAAGGALRVDPLALLAIGPRGAEAALAQRRQAEALARLRVEQQALAAELAEVFAVERVLRGLEPPAIVLEEAPFRAAGLASPAALAMLDAARALERAERTAIAAGRARNLAALRHLVGAGVAEPVDFVLAPPEFPPLSDRDPERLLSRPDLALALTRYYVADAELRVAVRRQYPTLRLGPELELEPTAVTGLVQLDVPVFGAGPARAAAERRAAAGAEVESALLEARQEAAELAAEHAAAAALRDASLAAADAMIRTYRSGIVRLELEPESLELVADMAVRSVREFSEAREAALRAARARVALARAYGWPWPEERP